MFLHGHELRRFANLTSKNDFSLILKTHYKRITSEQKCSDVSELTVYHFVVNIIFVSLKIKKKLRNALTFRKKFPIIERKLVKKV